MAPEKAAPDVLQVAPHGDRRHHFYGVTEAGDQAGDHQFGVRP
jgi:hypothetical protein